ncbi:hypothetical protein CC85DRAFT_303194 [Cutaneotrichosporon oleaginosum]|uniref:Uncharacterized protein n=1 Tax=Cutaneotrichosporon oleaginosum TaxID=879819 RepID=A0A0J0XK94_9TREE|nr:uncharacterized protein CC85DRAFT_303194 [Cutaneotrichosporon oleaginosum]KLT41516.1 hypothetical protein CC85DRAFT_303194 [Cutaneotrichosporon oleaginosum]TXT05835.1 hypothetical protein COLE_07155 [Cutaneotrichosporon oleaginosum]
MNRNDMLNNRQRTQNGFALPSLDNSSSSSLMDAVVGGQQRPTASANTMPTLSEGVARRNPGAAAAGKDDVQVQELERTLQKRRSLIPHLENELAELEAQIKAAEERLARATGAQAVGGTAQ